MIKETYKCDKEKEITILQERIKLIENELYEYKDVLKRISTIQEDIAVLKTYLKLLLLFMTTILIPIATYMILHPP
jgi:chaperonin cofactor prefoldin